LLDQLLQLFHTLRFTLPVEGRQAPSFM
jgi:hypothetical protein